MLVIYCGKTDTKNPWHHASDILQFYILTVQCDKRKEPMVPFQLYTSVKQTQGTHCTM